MNPEQLDALRDLSERYAAGADFRDADLYVSAFVPDGHLYVHDPADGPPVRERHGHQELAKVPGLLEARYDVTFHFLGNRHYRLGADGRTATGSVSCIASHVTRAAATNHVMHIRYDDDYVLDPTDEWKLQTRRCRVLFTETRPVD
jgi:hypothetical protein